MERHGAREGPDDQQDLVDTDGHGAEVVLCQVEPEVDGRGSRRRLDGGRVAVAGHDHPRHERVEEAEADHGDHRGPGDDLLGLLGLLAVDRGGLVADPRPEGEEDADRGRAGSDTGAERVRGQRAEGVADVEGAAGGQAVGAALDEHRDAESDEQDHLARQGDGEHAGGQGDRVVRHERDDGDAHDRDRQPVDADAERRRERVGGEVREAADERALEDDVGHRGEQARGHAPHLAETVGDEAVERAGGGDVARHGHEADGEDGQDDRREQEAGRGAGAVPVADRDRDVEAHGGDRGRVSDRHEQHADEADGAGLEPDLVLG